MKITIKKIISFILLLYLFFCFSMEAKKNITKQELKAEKELLQKPSYEELLQWHTLLSKLKINQLDKAALDKKDLDLLLKAIAQGKKKPFLKKRYYVLIFLACYLSYRVVAATKWYMEYWDALFKDLFAFFDFSFLNDALDWFKELFAYNPFAFLFDWFGQKEALEELDKEAKIYFESQKEFLLEAEKKQQAQTDLLEKIEKQNQAFTAKIDERLETHETLISSIKKETADAFTSLTQLLDESVDHATECKDALDKDFIACKETLATLKTSVDAQVEQVKKSNQATLLKEVLDIKAAVHSLKSVDVSAESVKKEKEEAPKKSSESSISAEKKASEPSLLDSAQDTGVRVLEGIRDYAIASVDPENFKRGVREQLLVHFLPRAKQQRKNQGRAVVYK